MSRAFRRKFAYWFCLIIGALGISKQLYSYLFNNLDLTIQEGILTIVCAAMIWRPNIISDSYKAIISKLTNQKNEQ